MRPSRILELGPRGLAAVVVPLLAALALGAGPALGAPACARQVVADWYDNGRVDRLYPLHCYREAIKTLPNDVLTYSSAREDINRALQFATRGKSDPGEGAQPPAAPSPPSPPPATSPPAPPPATTGKGTTTPRPTTPRTTAPEPVDTGVTEAAPPVDTSGPSAVPMPLIVLGGLALLLLAAGSAGYVTRRLQARRGGDGGEPPVAL